VPLGSAKAGSVELLPGFAGNRFELWRTRLRRILVERIRVLWKPDEAPLLDAMLLGEDSFLGGKTHTDFQRTGTYHVLVISGLKVAVLVLVNVLGVAADADQRSCGQRNPRFCSRLRTPCLPTLAPQYGGSR
jgi:predicted membrane metal-binding protein